VLRAITGLFSFSFGRWDGMGWDGWMGEGLAVLHSEDRIA
jgi:hypothetical protein